MSKRGGFGVMIELPQLRHPYFWYAVYMTGGI